MNIIQAEAVGLSITKVCEPSELPCHEAGLCPNCAHLNAKCRHIMRDKGKADYKTTGHYNRDLPGIFIEGELGS